MKTFVCLIFCCFVLSSYSFCQTTSINKIENLKSKNVSIHTGYLNVNLQTWDKDYIEIESDVTINMRNGDDKHDLKIDHNLKGLTIDSKIDLKSIERMVVLTDKDGNKSYTPISEWKKEMENKPFSNMNVGYEIDGELTIYLPKNLNLDIETTYGDVVFSGDYHDVNIHSTYGLIEAKLDDVSKMEQVSLKSTYDVVDLTIDKKSNAKLILSTSYGAVYTDLPLENKISSKSNSNNHDHDCSNRKEKYILNGGSVSIDIVATYDNIYVRSSDF